MWTEHTEYEEYHKLQLWHGIQRYQHNNTLGKISSNYRYQKKHFFQLSLTPMLNTDSVILKKGCSDTSIWKFLRYHTKFCHLYRRILEPTFWSDTCSYMRPIVMTASFAYAANQKSLFFAAQNANTGSCVSTSNHFIKLQGRNTNVMAHFQ